MSIDITAPINLDDPELLQKATLMPGIEVPRRMILKYPKRTLELNLWYNEKPLLPGGCYDMYDYLNNKELLETYRMGFTTHKPEFNAENFKFVEHLLHQLRKHKVIGEHTNATLTPGIEFQAPFNTDHTARYGAIRKYVLTTPLNDGVTQDRLDIALYEALWKYDEAENNALINAMYNIVETPKTMVSLFDCKAVYEAAKQRQNLQTN